MIRRPDHEVLIDERVALVHKKLAVGLAVDESKRLAEIRQYLDDVDQEELGPHLGMSKLETKTQIVYLPATSTDSALADISEAMYDDSFITIGPFEKHTTFESALEACRDLNEDCVKEPELPKFHVFKVSIIVEETQGKESQQNRT